MKLSTLFFVIFLLHANADPLYSQKAKVTINAEHTKLSELLEQVERQTDYLFFYNKKNIDVNKVVDVSVTDTPVSDVLDKTLGSEVTYMVVNNHIILSKKDDKNFSQYSVQYQGIPVTGTVTDETGEPMPGVNIQVKGTMIGTVSDVNGKYTINVPNNEAVLSFSFVGYLAQEMSVSGRTAINITLKESIAELEEIVVIGYGTVKKSDLTGSVSSLREKDMNKGVNSTITGILQGKAAGVQITQASAEPGGGLTVQIRGAGSINAGSGPLYVIDGLPIENDQVVSGGGGSMPGARVPRSPLGNINPADIESIEILKDASATAIYGSRGANGVIMVTTKKGASGRLKINYNGYYGLQTPKDMIEVLKAEDYQRILNEILDTPGSNVAQNERVTEIQDGGTVWQDEMLENSAVQSHSLSFTGGNERSKYFASLNYFDQDGVLKTSSYQRYDARFNMEHKADKFLFGLNFSTSYTHDNIVPIGFTTNEEGSSLYAARGFDPTLSIYNADGSYQTSSLINLDNPLALLYGKTSETDNYRTLGTVFGEYTILKGWTAKLNLGMDMRNSRRDTYVSRLTKDGRANSGVGTVMNGSRNNYLGEFTSTYNRELANNSSFSVMAGVTFQKFAGNNFSGTGKGFPVDESGTNNMGIAEAALYTENSSKDNNKLLSYIGRANYNLMDKFLFTATLRIDGSSRFENHKYGYFPSAAFAWKMSQHQFIQDLNVFSSLKFRASIGRTGNQDIGNYMSRTTFGKGANVILGGQQYVSLAPTRMANPDLKWETTEQINVGFDMGFIDHRLNVSIDYFQKNTYDMLFNLPIPPSTGYTSIMQNIGNIKNTGFECTIDSRNFVGEFSWVTSINLSTLKNRVTDTGDISEIIHTNAGQSTSQIAIIKEGETMNSFYGYKTAGLWQTTDEIAESKTKDPVKPGDVRFVDQNNDDVVNTSDRVILGKSFPTFTMGLTNEFSYKNFTLNIFMDAATGVSMLNNSKVETYYPVSHRRNRMAEPYLNRWTATNTTAKYPSFVNPAGQGNKAVSDLTVEDASYLRLQSVQLSYRVPLKSSRIFDHIGVYVSGQNLITWTNYTGQDPTTNSNGNSSLKIDFNSYPVYRTFIFGVEIGF